MPRTAAPFSLTASERKSLTSLRDSNENVIASRYASLILSSETAEPVNVAAANECTPAIVYRARRLFRKLGVDGLKALRRGRKLGSKNAVNEAYAKPKKGVSTKAAAAKKCSKPKGTKSKSKAQSKKS